MKRYKVNVTYHMDYVVIVEAESEQEAEHKADVALQEMDAPDMVAICQEGNGIDQLPEEVIEAYADGGDCDIGQIIEEEKSDERLRSH